MEGAVPVGWVILLKRCRRHPVFLFVSSVHGSGMRYAVLGMVSRCIMWHSAKSMHGRARPDDALSLMEQGVASKRVKIDWFKLR